MKEEILSQCLCKLLTTVAKFTSKEHSSCVCIHMLLHFQICNNFYEEDRESLLIKKETIFDTLLKKASVLRKDDEVIKFKT